MFYCLLIAHPHGLHYIVSGANLRANVFGIPQNRDAQMIDEVTVPDFTPRPGVKIEVTKADVNSRSDGQCGRSHRV